MSWQERMRELWIERVVWIRHYIISLMAGLQDLQFVSARLLRNGSEIANEFSMFFGETFAAQLEESLSERISLIAEFVSTLKMNYNTEPLLSRWETNLESFVNGIADVNPYWDRSVLRKIFMEQLNLQHSFIWDLYNGEYEQGIINFDLAMSNGKQTANAIIDGLELFLGQAQENQAFVTYG